MLDYKQAKQYYNHYGVKQDSQLYYEQGAFDVIIESVDWSKVSMIYELGCGTGSFIKQLFELHLPDNTHYYAMDISATMVKICQQRLIRVKDRISVIENSGPPLVSEQHKFYLDNQSVDVILATYVLDLLEERDIQSFINEAHQLLNGDGVVCIASITSAKNGLARWVSTLWSLVHRLKPARVGGCRALSLVKYLDESQFDIVVNKELINRGITSQVIIAKAITPK